MSTATLPMLKLHPRSLRRSFWTTLILGSVSMACFMGYALSHYRIGYSAEAEQSIGSAWTLVDLHGGAVPVGQYGVFLTDRRVHTFEPGTPFVKLVAGEPGDLIQVGVDSTTVNGHKVAGPLDSASDLGVPAQAFVRTFILGPDEYFAVGTRPHSYDSRHWGPVHTGQFIGQARLL